MKQIRVVVHGALGKMGQAVMAAVASDSETILVAGVDAIATGGAVGVPSSEVGIEISVNLDSLPPAAKPDVLVDFSVAGASLPAVRWAVEHGVSFVVGTTGLSDDDVEEMKTVASKFKVGGVVAENFALGAVVMMYLATKAARFFDHAEIIETHHEAKVDAPSGTALATAKMMVGARDKPFERNVPNRESLAGTRSGSIGGVTVHSVRLPGAMAHQQVIFGAPGQTVSIRHDTINRDCYGPGILLAIKHAVENTGFVHGLDQLLGLE